MIHEVNLFVQLTSSLINKNILRMSLLKICFISFVGDIKKEL